jgi:DNA-binding response OmpR family regulator
MATSKHILVVEDAEDLATVLRDRFRQKGYCVETVRDGDAARTSACATAYHTLLFRLLLALVRRLQCSR